MVRSRRNTFIWSLSLSKCTHCWVCQIPIDTCREQNRCLWFGLCCGRTSLQLPQLSLRDGGLSPKPPVRCVNVSWNWWWFKFWVPAWQLPSRRRWSRCPAPRVVTSGVGAGGTAGSNNLPYCPTMNCRTSWVRARNGVTASSIYGLQCCWKWRTSESGWFI